MASKDEASAKKEALLAERWGLGGMDGSPARVVLEVFGKIETQEKPRGK